MLAQKHGAGKRAKRRKKQAQTDGNCIRGKKTAVWKIILGIFWHFCIKKTMRSPAHGKYFASFV